MTLLTTHPAQAQAPPTPAGPELAFSIPIGLIADKRLTHLCVKVWMVFDKFPAPPMEEMARLTGSSPRSVLRVVTRLESCGWLLRLSRAGDSGCNSYITLRTTPSAARSSQRRAEAILATLTRRRTPSPMTDTERAVVGAWNHLCAETRRNAETW